MESYLKSVIFLGLCLMAMEVSGQSKLKDSSRRTANQGWRVSKEVQLISNKDLRKFRPATIKSVGTPSIVQSKGIHAKDKRKPVGNIRSTGYPRWIISKPVNLIHQ